MDGSTNIHHHIPVIMLFGQRVPYFGPNQFIGNGWHIWITNLQEQRQIPIGKVQQHAIVAVQVVVPSGIEHDKKITTLFV